MKKIFLTSLGFVFTTTYLQASVVAEDHKHSVRKIISSFATKKKKDIPTSDTIEHIFEDGMVSMQLESMYAAYNQKKALEPDTYATAIGGTFKYELASLYGFNAGVALTTSYDVGFATGDKGSGKQNSELSSTKGNYTQFSELYLNYKKDGLNIRGGRQLIDTPLADSDDIRMIHNTFEAYIVDYEIDNVQFEAGNLQRWQGYDAGLDLKWQKTGENGTWMFGTTYSDKTVTASAWYYDITKSVDAFYTDIDVHYPFNEKTELHSGLQYLHENEKSASGYAASIYGAMTELSLYDFNFGVAYNKSNKKAGKQSFSGFGGGTMFTSMDTMIIDNITQDRDAHAIVFGLIYNLDDWKFLYTHGDFYGGADSSNVKEHIREHDIGFEYILNEQFAIAAIYVKEEDMQNSVKTLNDWDRTQVMMKYDF